MGELQWSDADDEATSSDGHGVQAEDSGPGFAAPVFLQGNGPHGY